MNKNSSKQDPKENTNNNTNYKIPEGVISLRNINLKDLQQLTEWKNREDLKPYFIYQKKTTFQDTHLWFKKLEKSTNHLYMMELNSYHQIPLGMLSIRDIKYEKYTSCFEWVQMFYMQIYIEVTSTWCSKCQTQMIPLRMMFFLCCALSLSGNGSAKTAYIRL